MEAGETVHSSPPPDYKEPIGGGKRDRHPCADGKHDWECNKTGCPACWDPECEDNAKKQQDAYDAAHSRDGKSNEEKFNDYLGDAEKKKADEPLGATFEKQTLEKLGPDEVVYYQYSAHCRKCHVQGEVDIVTKSSVIECKNSAKGFKLRQMEDNIDGIRKACFPDKDLVLATRASEARKVDGKLKQWSGQGYTAGGTVMGV